MLTQERNKVYALEEDMVRIFKPDSVWNFLDCVWAVDM